MRITYDLYRGHGNSAYQNAPVATIQMERGVITATFTNDQDRSVVQPFLDDRHSLVRNRKMDDSTVYTALPGSRTWFTETIEQRLYYSAGYTYMVSEEGPFPGYLVVRRFSGPLSGGVFADEGHQPYVRRYRGDVGLYRGVDRGPLDEWPVLNNTLYPTTNGAALRHLLEVWEKGFADDGRIERAADALDVHSRLELPQDWEVIHCRAPETGSPPGNWSQLGIDVAQWGSEFFSAAGELISRQQWAATADSGFDEHMARLNANGLFSTVPTAEAFLSFYVALPDCDYYGLGLLEVWGTADGD